MKGEKESISKKPYRALEYLADGLLWINELGTIIHSNRNFMEVLGYQAEELINHKIFDLEFHSSPGSYSLHWKRLEKEEMMERQTFFLSSEEKLVPGTVRITLKGEDSIALWLISFQPFAPQNFELLDWCAGWNGIAGWQWDLLRGSLIVTPSFYSLFHLEKSGTVHRESIVELLKKRLNSVQLVSLTKALRELHHTRQPLEQELLFEWRGAVKNLFFRAEAIVKQEQVIQIRGFFREMKLKGERQQELSHYKNILDKIPQIVCWLTPECRFRYVNPAAVQQLGYSKSELLDGLRIMDIEVESTRKEWENRWAMLEDKDVLHVEGSFQRKKGSVFPVDIRLTRIHSGEEVLVSLVAHDISLERRKEARLRRALVEIDNLSQQLKEENIYLQKEVSSQYNFENIISRSPKYEKVFDQVKQVAPTDSTVLILGETGTGKELLARAIHRNSHRSERPLIKVDCGTLPKHLIESELFGHEKGAFTGAVKEKPGRFELADGGTLFLDEIGELPLELQHKLLRVLQEGEFTRVGGNQMLTVDVRIIVATNRNLREQVRKGDFRSDLFYRINIFPIYNLPLRGRPEDIPVLAEYFLRKYREKIGRKVRKIPDQAMEKLMQYDYPGNIRELESIIERAVILSSGEELSLNHWKPDGNAPEWETAPNQALAAKEETLLPFEEMQRRHILKALEKTNWRVSGKGGAAELLELNPQTLYSKMRKLDISRKKDS